MMERIENIGETAGFRVLRGRILIYLYRRFREYPYAPVELGEIELNCKTDVQDLNWNVVYLEKRGLVELGKLVESPPYIACTAAITTDGVDLVEDEAAFRRLFDAKPKSVTPESENHV